jgi:hypothetical protein
MRSRSWLLLLLLALAPAALAQDDCPAFVTDALQSVESICGPTGRNQACYGNLLLTATLTEDARQVSFEKTGDIADVANIQSMQLSALDREAQHWGVVLMKLQANIPDTVPGQNVTFLLFGDVEIVDASRTAGTGTGSDPVYGPMQAFYFKSGFRDRPCQQVPESGILVQSPKNIEITLNINSVDVSLGSTAFLQTGENALRFNVLEGSAEITSEGHTEFVPAGSYSTVPLDEATGQASGAPGDAQAYELDDFDGLPLDALSEDDDLTIAEPLSEKELNALIEAHEADQTGDDADETGAGGESDQDSGEDEARVDQPPPADEPSSPEAPAGDDGGDG